MSEPVSSMTGFGRAEQRLGSAVLSTEMRSVNQRFLRIIVRVPGEFFWTEESLKELVAGRLKRGQVDVTVRIDGAAEGVAPRYELDHKSFERHLEEWHETAFKLEIDEPPPVGALLSVPDVWKVHVPEEEERKTVQNAIMETAGQALDRLCEMRRREGTATRDDLASLVDELEEYVEGLNKVIPQVRERILQDTRRKVQELLQGADLEAQGEALMREIVYLADKSDVNEELKRLGSHIEQFRHALEEGGALGRRLEFLLQEVHREMNTLTSKAQDSEVSRLVVEGKVLVERAREQVQNLE